jgi:serine/threonine protein kinase
LNPRINCFAPKGTKHERGHQTLSFCDEEIRANAIKCKHCGSFLTDTAGMAAFSKTAIRQALMARFEIIDEIGRGGMGVVYKAIQKNLNRPVALKILPQHLIHQEEFLKRFHGEAQKAAQLNHKNIITVYDEGEEHGVHFISMEFIDGQNLKDVIVRNGPLPVATMMQWIKPVVDALGYAHNKSMIHRDIKSANILISKEGRPVLTDFGIARVMEDAQATRSAEASPLTRPGTILGTLQYMSPEQVQGKGVDGRSDIYSMGVVMYQCLIGELPFRGDTDWSAMHKITSEAPNRRAAFARIFRRRWKPSSCAAWPKTRRTAIRTVMSYWRCWSVSMTNAPNQRGRFEKRLLRGEDTHRRSPN